ncbi:hypothetical protein [Sulfuriroseicoccus oceanibius]|uniref:O-antigen polymerase n=1 Tax=Sulfuriroseicoccus oceanibius TaxID=2707525 RepID=A0A6B3LAZ5_9BACT|nr:hypothetical protein [Sulfuriroseicoccus oceanibius]QQL45626.1 hypothetical protein G3M56_003285 [Sulfuriroseicoccus oceanibius]
MNKGLMQILVAGGALFVAVLLMMGAVESSTSAVAYVVKYLGAGLAVLAMLKPRWGLFIVAGEAFTVDFLKKVAVYYGSPSMMTIIEVMVVVMLALVGAILGTLLGAVRSKELVIGKQGWMFLLGGLVIAGLAVVSDMMLGEGMMAAVQRGFNLGAYVAVGMVMLVFFRGKDDIEKFLNWCLMFVVASCLLAMKQTFFDFSEMVYFYMKTGLSPVASQQFYNELMIGRDPRAFGLASGVQNFNAVAALVPYCIYRLVYNPAAMRIVWGAALVVIVGALFVARIKTGFAVALLCPLGMLLFRSRAAILSFYAVGTVLFLFLVMNAQHLRDNIAVYDNAFRGFFGLDATYSIQTFEARLHGFIYLTKPESWSLFGLTNFENTELGETSHDIISSVLGRFGVVGLLGLLGACVVAAFFLHRAYFRIQTRTERGFYLALMTYFVLGIISNVVGGSNLHSCPVNLVVWSFAGGMAVLYRDYGWKKNSPPPAMYGYEEEMDQFYAEWAEAEGYVEYDDGEESPEEAFPQPVGSFGRG